ncbi:MAG: hypothetical protein RLZZ501_2251 [Pseudomonadota bacterium]|jgi:hypothetical protein
MAALSADRDTPEIYGRQFGRPVAAGAVIYAGALACLDATGYAVPASAVAGLTGDGRAEETIDNSAGAAGAATVRVRRGVFRWANAGDVTRAAIGDPAYAVDDQTVSADSSGSTRSAVGTIEDIDASGVWVRI